MRNYKFCPYCSSHSLKKDSYFECSNCKKRVYINSVPAAGVFLLQDDKYALCKRGIEPKKGMLDFIGGFLENGEHPEKGAIREVKEETCLNAKLDFLLGIYMNKYEYQGETIDVVNMIYVSSNLTGQLKPNDDIESVEWFDIGEIPQNLGFECIKQAVVDLQKWYKKN